MSTFVLANDTLRLEFERETGALVHIASADGTWQLLDRPQLGLSFRLLVPLPQRRNNNVLGEKQRASSVEVASDGHNARCCSLAPDVNYRPKRGHAPIPYS